MSEESRQSNGEVGMRASTRSRRPKKGEQLPLAGTGGWGGKRDGAGRKPSDPSRRSRVVHAKRPVHKGRHPVHVTLRARSGLPSFRQQRVHRLLAEVLRDQRRRPYRDSFRVVHYSVQGNHLHLIVEADSEHAEAAGLTALRAGISGLAIAFARRLNMMLGRRGKVWADRYHRHDLRTPKETWNGLAYVLHNFTHHGEVAKGDGVVDLYSSASVFEEWDGESFVPYDGDRWRWPICQPQTWLMNKGFLVHGRLRLAPHRVR